MTCMSVNKPAVADQFLVADKSPKHSPTMKRNPQGRIVGISDI
jgi:hypothetical protein